MFKLSDVGEVTAHGRIFLGMLALPPSQIVLIAAKDPRRGFNGHDGDAVVEGLAAFAADAGAGVLGRDRAVPRNPAVSCFIKTGSVNRANRLVRTRVPVLAVSPVFDEHGETADLTEGKLLFVGRRISPNATVAAIEAARAAIVRSAVGHPSSP
jgi:hypothetical protein